MEDKKDMKGKDGPPQARKRGLPQDAQLQRQQQQQQPGNTGFKKQKQSQPNRGNVVVQNSAADAVSADGEVNLPAYLEALEDSIEGLDNAMKQSKSSGAKRAFQQVPRDMRRRTASHDPSRMPSRLQSRAKLQMAADQTPHKPKKNLEGAAREKEKAKKAGRELSKALIITASLREGAFFDKTHIQPQPIQREPKTSKTERLLATLKKVEALEDKLAELRSDPDGVPGAAKDLNQALIRTQKLNKSFTAMGKNVWAASVSAEQLDLALCHAGKLVKVLSKAIGTRGPDDDGQGRQESDEYTDDDLAGDDLAAKQNKRKNDDRLPTHNWHAKRAKMSTLSNPFYDKPTPLARNQKTARSMHRAYNTSAFMSDLSHRGYIQVTGTDRDVLSVLERIGITYKASTDDWMRGCRVWVGMIKFPMNAGSPIEDVTPARAIWNPAGPSKPTSKSNPAGRSDGSLATSSATANQQREALIEVEPDSKDHVLKMLRSLEKEDSLSVVVTDLSTQLGCIDLLGPGSTDELLSIIRPYHSPDDDAYESTHWNLFHALEQVQPSMLLYNIYLAFDITFPEKPSSDDKIMHDEDNVVEELIAAQEDWATEENPRKVTLFDSAKRRKALHIIRGKQTSHTTGPSQLSMAAGDASGSNNASAAPSTTNKREGAIPVVLICSHSAVRGLEGRWTIICQRDLVRSLWHRLARHHQRDRLEVACIEEMHQIYTEQGVPFFPEDYPTTRAGFVWELKERSVLLEEWKGQPKGKRVDWASLDLGGEAGQGQDGKEHKKGEHGNPFACDWEILLVSSDRPTFSVFGGPGQEAIGEPKPVVKHDLAKKHPFLVQYGPGLPVDVGPCFLRNHFLPGPSRPASTVPQLGLLTVRITMVGAGVPKPRARVYLLPSRAEEDAPLRDAWIKEFSKPGQRKKTNNNNNKNGGAFDRRFKETLTTDERMAVMAKALTQDTDAIKAAPGGPSISATATTATTKNTSTSTDTTAAETIIPATDPTKADADTVIGNETEPESEPIEPETPDPDHHLPVRECDLVGFVTSGGFNLAAGKGQAIAHLGVRRLCEMIREGMAVLATTEAGYESSSSSVGRKQKGKGKGNAVGVGVGVGRDRGVGKYKTQGVQVQQQAVGRKSGKASTATKDTNTTPSGGPDGKVQIPFDAEENFRCLVRNVGETVSRPAVWRVVEEHKVML